MRPLLAVPPLALAVGLLLAVSPGDDARAGGAAASGAGPAATTALLPPRGLRPLPGWAAAAPPAQAPPDAGTGVDEDAGRLAVSTGPGSPVEAVKVVQRLLNRRGNALRVDGDWGPATTEALRRLQGLAGLDPSGRLDGATAELLRRP